MKNLTDVLAQDRRRVILQLLADDDDYSLNDTVLKQALASVGHNTPRDLVHADLTWLETHGLVRVQKLAEGDVWVARLTEAGQDVAKLAPNPVQGAQNFVDQLNTPIFPWTGFTIFLVIAVGAAAVVTRLFRNWAARPSFSQKNSDLHK